MVEDLELSRAAANSPLNKAMQQVNFEDTTKLESAANQPAALLKIQADWWRNSYKSGKVFLWLQPQKGRSIRKGR